MPRKTPEEDKRLFNRGLIKRSQYVKGLSIYRDYWQKKNKGEDITKYILRETYITRKSKKYPKGKRHLVARDSRGRFAKRFS